MKPLYVSRQSYWHEGGSLAVEIAGELEVSGPGALVEAYKELGEGQEFDDPREAAAAAVAIRSAWANDAGEPVAITLAMNDLVYPVTDDGLDDAEAIAWGQKRYDDLPKCDRCGGLGASPWTEYQFGETAMACREFCADELFAHLYETEEV